jgi:hypothetical protein
MGDSKCNIHCLYYEVALAHFLSNSKAGCQELVAECYNRSRVPKLEQLARTYLCCRWLLCFMHYCKIFVVGSHYNDFHTELQVLVSLYLQFLRPMLQFWLHSAFNLLHFPSIVLSSSSIAARLILSSESDACAQGWFWRHSAMSWPNTNVMLLSRSC